MIDVWKQVVEVVLPVVLVWLVGELIRVARVYAAKVSDETFRTFLLDMVKAAEQMFASVSGKQGEAKMEMVKALVPKATVEDIEAAVKSMKEFEGFVPTITRTTGEVGVSSENEVEE